MLTVTQIKQLTQLYGLRPNKRLGQNFIIDRNIVDKIKDLAGLKKEDIVVEIGAGLGNITADIAGLVKKVIAVEFDKGLFGVMKKTLSGYRNIEVVYQDILKFDFRPYAKQERLRIVGNLPYYITTPILERIIENRDYIKDAFLMVQKEVSERMVARPGTKSYGSISCYLSYFTELEFKAVVKKSSFFPKPEVDSALIYLKVLDRPPVSVNNEELFFKIIRSSFNQRRKMIASSLSNKKILGLPKDRVKTILERAIGSSERRPESISLEEFARISNEFAG